MQAGTDPAAPLSPPRLPSRRRHLALVLLIAAVVVAGTALLIRFGPQLVAQQVARTYLRGLNVDTSGVDTLRIHLLRGYFSFGPVTFGGSGATAGQVGRIGVNLDARRLIQGKALVQSIVIEGVRFEIRQAEDGSFSLNGIPLGALLAEQVEAPGAPEPVPDGAAPAAPAAPKTRSLHDELGWYAGLEQLQIRDSRAVFLDARGGEAVMQVNALDLIGFHSWTPENPGQFKLDAELNDIALTASGIARPFADKFEVEGQAAVSGIKLPRIERYLGPLGFTSQAGRVDLALSSVAVSVFVAGQVDARLAASGTMTDVDLAHPLFGSGQLATGVLRLDNVSLTYAPTRQTTVMGDVDVDLQSSAFRLRDGTEAGFSHARFGLPGTVVKSTPGKLPEVKVAPQLDVADLRLGGSDVRGTVGTVAVRLNGFSIEGTEAGAPFFASGSVAVDRIDLRLPEAEPIAIRVDQARLDLAETQVAFPPDRGAQVEGGVSLDARTLAVTVDHPTQPGRPVLPQTRFAAGRLAVALPKVTFDNAPPAGSTAVGLQATGPRLSVEDLRLSGPDIEGSVGGASVALASVALANIAVANLAKANAGNAAPLISGGTVAAEHVDLLLPDVEPVTIALRQLRGEIGEARVPTPPGAEPLATGISLNTQDLRVTIQELGRRDQPPPPPTRIDAANVAIAVPAVTANAADATVRAAKPRVSVDRLQLGGPDIQGTIAGTDVQLAGIDVETRSPGTPIIATGKVVARTMDLLVPDVEPIAIAADTVNATLNRTRFAFPSGRSLIDGAVALDSRQLAILIHQRAADAAAEPPPPIGISASRFAGEVPRLVVEDSRATGTQVKVVTPGLTLERFRLVKPKSAQHAMQLASPSLTLQQVDVDVNDAETLTVAGKARIAAADLAVALAAEPDAKTTAPGDAAMTSGPTGDGKIHGLDLNVQRFSYREAGAETGFGLQGRIGLAAFQGDLAAARQGVPADRLALAGLKLDIADLDLVKGGEHPAWRARLDFDLGRATADINGPLAAHGSVNAISLAGLNASSAERTYSLDHLTLGGFDAAITRLSAPEKPQPPEAPAPEEPATAQWPPADLPTVKLGRVALLDPGRLKLVDATVAPPVDSTLTLDALSLTNLDTTDPNARTALTLQARLDDSRISLDGWAEPFRREPSFKMRAAIDDLRLPAVWPYLGPKIGLDVFRGTLTLGADAAVADGQLDAEVRTRLTGVRLRDRQTAESAATSRALGIPLSTLIRLIEDRDGAIDVTVPLRGDLLSPDVRYGPAVWSLLPHVLRALVTSPVQFISSAVEVIQATSSDTTPPPPQTAATR